MMKKQSLCLLLMAGLLFLFSVPAVFSDDHQIAEDDLKQIAPRVYLDCQRCDRDYIRYNPHLEICF